MSYNTRRGAANYGGTPSSAVGQRRPGNFQNQQHNPPQKTPTPQTPNRPQGPAPQQARTQQQQPVVKTPVQQQTPKPVQNVPTPQVKAPPTPVPVVQPPPQEPKIVFKKDPTPEVVDNGDVVMGGENGEGDGTTKPKRVLFFRTGKGRISKKERLRKRNQRLRKILQPKNAPMVLNELVGSVTYSIIEAPCGFTNDESSFKASVLVDEAEHSGYGKSKALAKSNAAEAAIKHLVLKKVTSNIAQTSQTSSTNTSVANETEEDQKMDVVPEEDDSFSWSHVASFALHKLFNSWDEINPEKMVPKAMQSILTSSMSGLSPSPGNLARLVANPHAALEQKPEHKPAKKMPDNANEMNPIMLLNQMRPLTYYEEVAKAGVPPNVRFTFKCNVDGQGFNGTGASKKTARKHAAYVACQSVLSITYSQEVLEAIASAS